jgi:hypothetical protein
VTFLSERGPLWQTRPIGFTVVAGADEGLRTLLLIRGTLPAADRGFIHYHDGDENHQSAPRPWSPSSPAPSAESVGRVTSRSYRPTRGTASSSKTPRRSWRSFPSRA